MSITVVFVSMHKLYIAVLSETIECMGKPIHSSCASATFYLNLKKENYLLISYYIRWLYPINAIFKDKRAPSTTAIFNRNRNFQRQPRQNFPCMGSSNRNHHRNLQVAVAVAADQNFLIFGGRSLKSRLRLRWCMGRNDQICHISADICMLLN